MTYTSEELMLHAILYSKSHYQRDATLKGLRVIVGHYSLMDPEFIDDTHLMHFALGMLEKFKPKVTVSDVVTGCFREAWKWRMDASPMMPQGAITQLDMVEYILLEIRHMRVVDLPPLPVADANIYPLKDNNE